jgi:hypothetical protein|tara:strand:+ start:864 stop:1007 length:144 start_codon:yes stop_codon:yes gene_type:complete
MLVDVKKFEWIGGFRTSEDTAQSPADGFLEKPRFPGSIHVLTPRRFI